MQMDTLQNILAFLLLGASLFYLGKKFFFKKKKKNCGENDCGCH
jgi:hypothetical protein